MIYEVKKATFFHAPVNYNEVARYAGTKSADEEFIKLAESCLSECEKEKAINYAVCFTETPLSLSGDTADFSAFKVKSKDLVYSLRGASTALVFACTLGVGIDRLIKKYSATSPLRALVMQALGAERVETFTDLFIDNYQNSRGVRLSPRFSAGYGDLSLSSQRDIFALLSPEKRLGLTLNDSLLMSPSKSVTAFAGINGEAKEKEVACKNCGKENCGFRR